MNSRNHYKTIVLSDIHLGSKNSKAKEVVRYLKKNTCDTLILNGDIIDGWQIRKGGKWKKKHTRFFRVVLKMMEKHKTELIYLRGNHDDFLDNIAPFIFGEIWIVKDHIHFSKGKKYLILHGDIFDSITTNLRWLAMLGDVGYTFLLWLNKVYNNRRSRKGLPYFSFSQLIKQKVKSAVSYISDYEKELVKLARAKGCDGVICGHIHHPAITQYDDITYMNSGDWVESLTALVEDYHGEWKIIYYADWVKKDEEHM
jgi:UDP-2,3-diacylglucosamine pyrophosphatase LpxH